MNQNTLLRVNLNDMEEEEVNPLEELIDKKKKN